MLIKVFARGTGGGRGPVEYVCAFNPFGQGQRSRKPEVIKGNPTQMRAQIDAVPFKWKYTSGVISFAKEDAPTSEHCNCLMDDFEDLAFAGLPYSSRSILWVRHHHTDREELHFIIPRQEVHSGMINRSPPYVRIMRPRHSKKSARPMSFSRRALRSLNFGKTNISLSRRQTKSKAP